MLHLSCEPEEERLGEVVRAIGVERVLFASDYPHWDAKLSGSQMIIERNDLDDDAKRKIMGENAARLLRLD